MAVRASETVPLFVVFVQIMSATNSSHSRKSCYGGNDIGKQRYEYVFPGHDLYKIMRLQ